MTQYEHLMIKEMKKMQSRLDDAILKEHQCEYDLEKSKLALLDELGETNHEAKANWCWWKFTQAPVNEEKLLEELVDSWHFALSIDNHENAGIVLACDIIKYSGFKLSTLMAWAITKPDVIIPIMINITKKLGFTVGDVHRGYIKKNKVNYQRLESGY